MTIYEIEKRLPNGFHDAIIKSINVDYFNHTLRMEINIDVSNINDTEILSKSVILNITDLIFCVFEPPDFNYYKSVSKGIWITGSYFEKPKKLSFHIPCILPYGAFEHYFYISDWNSFITIVAMNAKLDTQGD